MFPDDEVSDFDDSIYADAIDARQDEEDEEEDEDDEEEDDCVEGEQVGYEEGHE